VVVVVVVVVVVPQIQASDSAALPSSPRAGLSRRRRGPPCAQLAMDEVPATAAVLDFRLGSSPPRDSAVPRRDTGKPSLRRRSGFPIDAVLCLCAVGGERNTNPLPWSVNGRPTPSAVAVERNSNRRLFDCLLMILVLTLVYFFVS